MYDNSSCDEAQYYDLLYGHMCIVRRVCEISLYYALESSMVNQAMCGYKSKCTSVKWMA